MITATLSGAPAGVTYSFYYADANNVAIEDIATTGTAITGAEVSSNVVTLATTTLSSQYVYVVASKDGYTSKMAVTEAAVSFTPSP